MNLERNKNRNDAGQIATANSTLSAPLARRIASGAFGVALSVMLTACGGGNGSTPGAVATSLSKTEAAEVAAAASAAKSESVPLATALKMNATSITDDTQTDRFIVKYKDGTAELTGITAVQSRLEKFASAFPSRAHHLRRTGVGADVVMTERKLSPKETKAFMRAIATDPDVEYVEPDAQLSVQMVPNDPLLGQQWGMTQQSGIRPQGAWDLTDGSGQIIAIVDNGVTHHSDLDGNLLPGIDARAGHQGGDGFNPGITTSTETCSGVLWHGLQVAGVAAAISNNGNGIAGTAGGAKIVSVRVADACGIGNVSDVADGIEWASGATVPGLPANAYPVNVINVSMAGAGACSSTMQQAINDATGRGVSVVGAAGNDNSDSSGSFPGNCRNILNAGSVDVGNNRGNSSNYGPTVDLAAPGSNVFTLGNAGATSPGEANYGFFGGSSFAAPAVSGVIALAQSVAPKPFTPAEMRVLLMRNTHAFAPNVPDQPLGTGVLDATATVLAAKSGNIPAVADFICTQGAAGMMVTCNDKSSSRGAPIQTWAWNMGFGDPNYMLRTQSVNPYYDYEYPGTYQITLNVTDSTGAVSSLSRPIKVVAPPTLQMSVASSPVKFSAPVYVMQYFSQNVPDGSKSVTFTLAPGNSNDVATLYVRSGSPTTVNPECQAVAAHGNAATCTITNPTPGTYYGVVNPNSNLTNATIQTALTK
jgi:serine protease